MTREPKPGWSCNNAGGAFPLIATALGVASCFAEPLLKKHVQLGSGFEVILALAQAVPFAVLLRYFATRLSARSGLTSTPKI